MVRYNTCILTCMSMTACTFYTYIVHVRCVECHLNLCFRNACEKFWGEELKGLIEERGKTGNIVTIIIVCHPLLFCIRRCACGAS